jgi:hypothetical protein
MVDLCRPSATIIPREGTGEGQQPSDRVGAAATAAAYGTVNSVAIPNWAWGLPVDGSGTKQTIA